MNLSAQNWDWQTVTSMYQINSVDAGQSQLWCGTSGGLLSWSNESLSFQGWTNTDGLAANEITAIYCNDDGTVWIGFGNGLLQRFDPTENRWLTIDDYFGNQIVDLVPIGDSLFVALNIGLSLFIPSRQEVKETYRNLGFRATTGNYLTDIPVNVILLSGDEIWVGTNEGLAYATLGSQNLMDPENWDQVTTADGIPDKSVSSLCLFNDELYAGTDRGLSRRVGDVWTILDFSTVYDIHPFQDRLIVAMSRGILAWTGEIWEDISGEAIASSLAIFENELWAGTDRGLIKYDISNTNWIQYLPNTPPSNLIADLAIDENGAIWCCSRNSGFFGFDDNQWVTYNTTNIPESRLNDYFSVLVGSDQSKWFGSWGDGITRLMPDQSLIRYRVENGFLHGIAIDASYAVANDLALGPDGTVWIMNLLADNNQPIIAVTPDEQWTYYGADEGISTLYLKRLTVDPLGRVWIGSEFDGVFVLDPSNTPNDKSDDPSIGRLTTSDGLETNEVTALASDFDGGIWIGTPVGLHYYFAGGLTLQHGLPSDNITALAVDGANNIWIGTQDGLCTFINQSFECTLFTEDNSDLISNEISSLSFDENSGSLLIGTSKGFSILKTPFSEPVSELTTLKVFPNPFEPKRHGVLSIDDLARDVSVNIFSSSGMLVKSYSQDQVSGRRLFWDGTNNNGEEVASGIYFIVAALEAGESRVAKIAVVR